MTTQIVERKITIAEALREGIAEEMRRDPDVFIMGEEVAEYQGAYKVTQGLLQEFGARRVIDTPITESGFTGPLNWYRNFDRNWELTAVTPAPAITVPTLFLAGSADPKGKDARNTLEAMKIALRTQQIIAHESGVADFVDALGGSYAIEALTDRIEAGAQKYLDRIDELGGMVSAIEQGYPQREIQNTAIEFQEAQFTVNKPFGTGQITGHGPSAGK